MKINTLLVHAFEIQFYNVTYLDESCIQDTVYDPGSMGMNSMTMSREELDIMSLVCHPSENTCANTDRDYVYVSRRDCGNKINNKLWNVKKSTEPRPWSTGLDKRPCASCRRRARWNGCWSDSARVGSCWERRATNRASRVPATLRTNSCWCIPSGRVWRNGIRTWSETKYSRASISLVNPATLAGSALLSIAIAIHTCVVISRATHFLRIFLKHGKRYFQSRRCCCGAI